MPEFGKYHDKWNGIVPKNNPPPPEERFWKKVEKTDSCWIWKAWVGDDGYGRFVTLRSRKGKYVAPPKLAHRYAWELINGSIPKGMLLLHTCDNRLCVRPDHLRIGTHAENQADMKTKGRVSHGQSHHNAKLTNLHVVEIRRKYKKWEYGIDRLAKEFGVSKGTIWDIVDRKSWKRAEQDFAIPKNAKEILDGFDLYQMEDAE